VPEKLIATLMLDLHMFSSKRLSKDEASIKIRSFCNYQERSHKEVKEKLYSYKLPTPAVDEIISALIDDNLLCEERFARLFAGGKFRMKHWGRKKIQYELQQKGVSKANIKIGLSEIDDDSYGATLTKLAVKKWDELPATDPLTRQAKVYAYLLQKGYEQSLIANVIEQIRSGTR
jgi:regulatory protein